jgi:hypothetical protein
METKRKLQLGALAVIVNGFAVIGGLSPEVAQANPCSPVSACSPPRVCMNQAQYCADIAPAGCTATSSTCEIADECSGYRLTPYLLTCYFN